MKVLHLAAVALTSAQAEYKCLDDTRFVITNSNVPTAEFSCPPGLCFTRNPPSGNPCIGKQLALQIDGAAATTGSAPAKQGSAQKTTAPTTPTPVSAPAPATGSGKPKGTQFVTGPCSADDDCASGCCERKANTCRNLPALITNVQSCKDGRTPDFSGPQGMARNIDTGAIIGPLFGSAATTPNLAVAKSTSAAPATGSGKPKGTQFVTGPCSADDDCASGCCERTANTCRNLPALTSNVQSCKDGRTPDYSGPQGMARNIDTGAIIGPLFGNAVSAPSTPAPSTSSKTTSPAPATGSGKPKGTQFVTGPCSADDDCASGCCERKANTCRNLPALTSNVQSCKDGRTPDYSGPQGMARNIDTGAIIGPLF